MTMKSAPSPFVTLEQLEGPINALAFAIAEVARVSCGEASDVEQIASRIEGCIDSSPPDFPNRAVMQAVLKAVATIVRMPADLVRGPAWTLQ